jgi:hypothetical protein
MERAKTKMDRKTQEMKAAHKAQKVQKKRDKSTTCTRCSRRFRYLIDYQCHVCVPPIVDLTAQRKKEEEASREDGKNGTEDKSSVPRGQKDTHGSMKNLYKSLIRGQKQEARNE